MNNSPPKCPKCNEAVVQGFVPDYSQSAAFVGTWHAGPPQKSFWTRTKINASQGIPIGAFRCERCGFLEFYANPNFAAK